MILSPPWLRDIRSIYVISASAIGVILGNPSISVSIRICIIILLKHSKHFRWFSFVSILMFESNTKMSGTEFQSSTNFYEHAHILCLVELSTKIRESSDNILRRPLLSRPFPQESKNHGNLNGNGQKWNLWISYLLTQGSWDLQILTDTQISIEKVDWWCLGGKI